jgi:carboxyl-terminal processing protease
MMVRGMPGTTLKMIIEREGEPKPMEFILVREEIPVRNVTYAGFVADGVGYIRLERFSRTAGDDVRTSIKELRGKGDIKAIILDLRDNPGGLLDVAVDVASKFLPESTLVVSTKGRRNESERKYYSTETPMLADVPMAVLIDNGSASASEIVAGAVQDLDRGVLVGTRSFGKGLVQTITRITENSSLKITSGRYYTPSGRSIQEIDYFHRDKDGVVKATPDSLRHNYRTVHGRVVRDGGGIVPDSLVPDVPSGRFFEEIVRRAMFFKYANRVAAEKKTMPADLQITDEVLKSFEAFLKEREFNYEEDAEAKVKELREVAQKSRYGPAFLEGLDRLSKDVEKEKARGFERYDKEIRRALRLELFNRLKGEKAAIEASLKDDTQLQVALALVRSKTLYQSLLKPSKR